MVHNPGVDCLTGILCGGGRSNLYTCIYNDPKIEGGNMSTLSC